MTAYAEKSHDGFAASYALPATVKPKSGAAAPARPLAGRVGSAVAARSAAAPIQVVVSRRRSRDVSGAVLLFVAAAVGLFSWFGPWSSAVPSVTGRTVFESLRDFRAQSTWAVAIQVVLIASIVVGATGATLLVRSYLRRWFGLVALLAALATIAAEIYYLIQSGFDFSGTSAGYWAFLAAGFVMLVASVKALGTPG